MHLTESISTHLCTNSCFRLEDLQISHAFVIFVDIIPKTLSVMHTSQDTIGRDDRGTPFVNIKSDYGFKWFFGQIKRKHILIRFLNALFRQADRDIVVEDIAYHDKEILPV